jgi:hypothetical protein
VTDWKYHVLVLGAAERRLELRTCHQFHCSFLTLYSAASLTTEQIMAHLDLPRKPRNLVHVQSIVPLVPQNPHSAGPPAARSSNASFLGLPRELRNTIYAHMVVPAAPLSIGLYLSCKQIQAEYSQECRLALQQFARSAQSSTQGLRVHIEEPSSYAQKCNLQLSLSTEVFADDRDLHLRWDRTLPANMLVLHPILSNHFKSVTFAFSETNGVPFGELNRKWLFLYMGLGVLRHENIRVGRIVFEIPLHIERTYMEWWCTPRASTFWSRQKAFESLRKPPFWLINSIEEKARLVCEHRMGGTFETEDEWVEYGPQRDIGVNWKKCFFWLGLLLFYYLVGWVCCCFITLLQ